MEPENNLPTQPQSPQPQTEKADVAQKPLKKPLNRKVLIIIGILLLAIALLSALILTRNGGNQTAENQQSVNPLTENVLLATVGINEIYSNEAKELANSYLDSSEINLDIMREYRDILIERYILDWEANTLGLTVDREALNAQLFAADVTESSPTYDRDFADLYYENLKTQIEGSLVSGVSLSSISYWIPAPTDPEAEYPEYSAERLALSNALSQANTLLTNGADPYDTALTVYNNNPDAQRRLAFNGVVISSIGNQVVEEVREYDMEELSGPGDYFYNGVVNMEIGEVRLLEDPEDRGGYTVKVLGRETSEFADYNEFLEARKLELVRIVFEL